jgi:hypothetical protein
LTTLVDINALRSFAAMIQLVKDRVSCPELWLTACQVFSSDWLTFGRKTSAGGYRSAGFSSSIFSASKF